MNGLRTSSEVFCQPEILSLRWSTVMACLILFAQFWVGNASARTWIVSTSGDGDAPTIQAAIDSSTDGDMVFVLPGRFHEAIDFRGKAIVVHGSGIDQSIIDGLGLAQSCVTFVSGEDERSVIEGFTITGGEGWRPSEGTPPAGGGVFCLNSGATVRRNRIAGNRCWVERSRPGGYGGGVFAGADKSPGPSVLISGNEIADNEAGRQGGGIRLEGTIHADVFENVIVGNRTEVGDGGGISFGAKETYTRIIGNTILNNESGDKGGGVFVSGTVSIGGEGTVIISDNVIYLNRSYAKDRADQSGGGIWVGYIHAVISGNTIVANRADWLGDSTGGGGILLHGSGTVTVERNIIAFNTYGSGIACFLDETPTIQNNLLWGNFRNQIYSKCGEFLGRDGNVELDPDFCDWESGNLSLGQRSPAMEHEAGPLGAVLEPGCLGRHLVHVSWSGLKVRFDRMPIDSTWNAP